HHVPTLVDPPQNGARHGLGRKLDQVNAPRGIPDEPQERAVGSHLDLTGEPAPAVLRRNTPVTKLLGMCTLWNCRSFRRNPLVLPEASSYCPVTSPALLIPLATETAAPGKSIFVNCPSRSRYP